MTPSGRSFWVLGENNTAFGLKFHVPSDADTSVILNRGLDPEMIRNTVICSDELASYPEAMDESYGASLQFGPDVPQKFAFLWRNFKWDLLRPEPGQVIVSMPVLLSQSLWAADEVLAHLEFPVPAETNMRRWFTEELAPHMAELISTSLFKTGLHPEVHQQNLSVILQDGHFKHMIYHDLQDCLHDPVTRFLLLNVAPSTDGPDLSAFRTRQMLALPGEILSPANQDKLFISLSDWWRRWLRVFGRYDRILNVLWGHDPFRETVFEDAVCTRLHLAAERVGLTLTAESKSYGLFTFMAWAQYEFQQKLLPQFFSNCRSSLMAATENDLNLFSDGVCLASARAPWSHGLLSRWLHENRGTAWKMSCGEDRFVFLKSDSGCHLYFYRKQKVHIKSHAPL